MNKGNTREFDAYRAEARERWGNTDAYREFAEKTKAYPKNAWDSIADRMDEIFKAFALLMKNGAQPETPEVQQLVDTLRNHITENYYTCTPEILAGLGQMYVADERFQSNIDRNGEGTAAFVNKAIQLYRQNR